MIQPNICFINLLLSNKAVCCTRSWNPRKKVNIATGFVLFFNGYILILQALLGLINCHWREYIIWSQLILRELNLSLLDWIEKIAILSKCIGMLVKDTRPLHLHKMKHSLYIIALHLIKLNLLSVTLIDHKIWGIKLLRSQKLCPQIYLISTTCNTICMLQSLSLNSSNLLKVNLALLMTFKPLIILALSEWIFSLSWLSLITMLFSLIFRWRIVSILGHRFAIKP